MCSKKRKKGHAYCSKHLIYIREKNKLAKPLRERIQKEKEEWHLERMKELKKKLEEKK